MPPPSMSTLTQLLIISCNELSDDYLSGIVRPDPTFWNVRVSALFLPSLSVSLIINDQVATTAIEQQVRLTTNGVALLSHTIKRETWTPQILDSFDWDSVATTMVK